MQLIFRVSFNKLNFIVHIIDICEPRLYMYILCNTLTMAVLHWYTCTFSATVSLWQSCIDSLSLTIDHLNEYWRRPGRGITGCQMKVLIPHRANRGKHAIHVAIGIAGTLLTITTLSQLPVEMIAQLQVMTM